MALSTKLQMRQSQSLAMTPQLLQSIRLLQYDHRDLKAFLESEAERNPLIELHDAVPEGRAGQADTRSSAHAGGEEPFRANGRDGGNAGLPADRPFRNGNASRHAGAPDGAWIENIEAARPSLNAHAASEIAAILPGAGERRVAAAIARHLNAAGYVDTTIDAIARDLNQPAAEVARVLKCLQENAEPAGLFASGLKECLALQLKRIDRFDPLIAIAIDNLDLLAKRDFATLQRLTGEDASGILDMLSEIRRLDPKPGAAFHVDAAPPIVPDILLTRTREDGWRVELNPAALPRVLVNESYASEVESGGLSSEDRSFLAACRQAANWLERSLSQRARSIQRVATEIVRHQETFFSHGETHLKPLTLMAVAEAIGMHESTVSRVIANKFIQTPRGTFALKHFFSVALASSTGGEAHSAESVKHRLRSLIASEADGKVLSDDDLCAALRGEGVEIARRTVAKYREALGIASSVQRRREMKARRIAS